MDLVDVLPEQVVLYTCDSESALLWKVCENSLRHANIVLLIMFI